MTTTDTITHGSQPCQPGTAPSGRAVATGPRMAYSGSCAGLHTFRKAIVTTRDTMEDSTSVRL